MAGEHVDHVDALLVGYENQENLGLRSIMATLLDQGFRAMLVPFAPGLEDAVLEVAHNTSPSLIGFSLIFQYSLDDYGALMRHLRSNGIRSHFTAGGHFPSLNPQAALELLPELDSIVRFEGELTLPDLLLRLNHPDTWHKVHGLAYRSGEEICLTPQRPLTDLDRLPPVFRDHPKMVGRMIPTASMLASRGCLYNCSFCSIRQFYGAGTGELRRARNPRLVVEEMQLLFLEQGVRFFTFQDDDFAARSPAQKAWLESFLECLDRSGLSGEICWKISCRVDDLSEESLGSMVERGLMAVYLGVESGNETGLRILNKHTGVERNLAAIELVKKSRIALAMGFMLFDPSSTFETLRENISFLATVGNDGHMPINFCKMLPYSGTPIEGQLRAQGRLKGTASHPDYGFETPEVDWYAFLVQRIFTRRNFTPEGLVARLQQADFEYRLATSFGRDRQENGFQENLRKLVSRSNRLATDTLAQLLDEMGNRGADALLAEETTLLELAGHVWEHELAIEHELDLLLASPFFE